MDLPDQVASLKSARPLYRSDREILRFAQNDKFPVFRCGDHRSSVFMTRRTLDQRQARGLEAPRAAMPLGQFRPQNLAQDTYATRNLPLFHSRKTEPQGIRL